MIYAGASVHFPWLCSFQPPSSESHIIHRATSSSITSDSMSYMSSKEPPQNCLSVTKSTYRALTTNIPILTCPQTSLMNGVTPSGPKHRILSRHEAAARVRATKPRDPPSLYSGPPLHACAAGARQPHQSPRDRGTRSKREEIYRPIRFGRDRVCGYLALQAG